VLFYLGVLVGYSFVFPLTLRFLATYQVSDAVPNTISLLSYISSFLSLILIMGLAFEIPAVAALLSRVGILTKQILKKYRKYAVVAAMVLSAVITPSGDAFTMLMVALPLYFLYELSIILSKNSITNNDIDK
jgi:sec-independent protein translocase protein TatC